MPGEVLIQYAIVAILLFSGLLLYFKIAGRYHITDKPNERSSHDYITIRGGGIVFWLAAALYVLYAATVETLQATSLQIAFLIGITLISTVSFIDDIKSLPNKIRIVIHFLSISCVFYGLNLYAVLPWYLIITAYIFFVGILNAYNFMDGINGITGFYSLVILLSLQYINQNHIHFTAPDFINYAIISCIVFLFFNFRKRAKCFAGDVGSMAISFWIVTLLLQLMLKTNSMIWILLLAVYGIDTVLTLIHRLVLKENIFQAHRKHLYQQVANEMKTPQLVVSTVYGLLQGIIAVGFFVFYEYQYIYFVVVIIFLSMIYILLRNLHLNK
jgi:UDP-N-acetylmuramyl pentapeptide phosphotransferase/UDP-N-acetylglucosamine-1-phosphate transferase